MGTSYDTIWQHLLDEIKHSEIFPNVLFRQCIIDSRLVMIEDGLATIAVNNEVKQSFITYVIDVFNNHLGVLLNQEIDCQVIIQK